MNKPRQELVTHTAQAMPVAEPLPQFSFQDMQRMAVSIAKANIFGIKDPDQAIALMLIAHSEGRHPATVARDYDIIQGRPAKKAEAILRDFQASGGRVEWHQLDDKCAAATFSHPAAVKPVRIDWDLTRAKQAGLMDKNGGMYSKYPRAMLRSRCVSEGCRTVAPQATSGFYTPEEVREFDPEPQAELTPIAAAIEQTANAQTPDEVEALIAAMDTLDPKALEQAFGAAWRSTKDPILRQRFKSVYDAMKAEIARVAEEAPPV
jgi:hypothetical protein